MHFVILETTAKQMRIDP